MDQRTLHNQEWNILANNFVNNHCSSCKHAIRTVATKSFKCNYQGGVPRCDIKLSFKDSEVLLFTLVRRDISVEKILRLIPDVIVRLFPTRFTYPTLYKEVVDRLIKFITLDKLKYKFEELK